MRQYGAGGRLTRVRPRVREERQSGWRTDRRGGLGSEAFAVEGGAAAIALHVHLEDHGVVHEPVDRGDRHGGVRKDRWPRP